MKKFFVSMIAVLSCIAVNAADNKVSVSLYGFVTNQMYWQNRANYDAVDGLLNFIPKDESLNADGEDVNEQFNSRMIAINTRLGLVLNGPEILGAQTKAVVEGDFSTAGMCFFLRMAYIDFKWDRDKLLFGQTGHPMCTDLMPGTINIAIGSPFNALNRSPMLRYDHYFGENKNWNLTGAAIYQFTSGKSTGPNGMSNEYHSNCGIPELWAGINYTKKGFSIETGVDWLQLRPRTIDAATGRKVNEHYSSVSALLQLSYNKGKLSLRAKTLYGGDMSHLNLASGYGVSAIHDDGSYEYAPLKVSSSWIFASYGRTWKFGILGGYMKNLGASADLVNPDELLWVYRGGQRNIDQMYRIAPQVEYYNGNFSLGLEYEMTTVAYGKVIESRGTVSDTHNVTNHRVMFVAKYSF